MTEDEMVGGCHWFDGHEFQQALGIGDPQGSLVCCSSWGHKESDTTEWLIWTELSTDIEHSNMMQLVNFSTIHPPLGDSFFSCQGNVVFGHLYTFESICIQLTSTQSASKLVITHQNPCLLSIWSSTIEYDWHQS